VCRRGAFGVLTSSNRSKRRLLDIDLRTGDYALDSTHAVRGTSDYSDRFNMIEIPVDDDPDAIRSVLWYNTDQKYKRAVEQLTKVKANVQVKVEQEDRSADFSKEPADVWSEPVVPIKVDRAAWEERVRRYSQPFAAHGDIYEGAVFLSAGSETRWYVSSDGSAIQTSQPTYRLGISA